MDWITVECLFLYWYNTRPEEIVDAVYDNPEDDHYRAKKVDSYKRGLITFWSELDYAHQKRMLQAASDKYLDEVIAKQRLRNTQGD